MIRQRFWSFIDSMPYAAPAALAAFALVVVPFILFDQFKAVIIWPLGLVAAAIVWIYVVKRITFALPYTKASRWCTLIVLLFATMWGIGNSFYSGQHVFTNRDPAAYALTGVWLTQNESVKIDKQKVLGGIDTVSTQSGGFIASLDKDEHLYARGPHLFPAFLALVGKLNTEALFWINSFIGALAIVALYGLIRLWVDTRWALFASVSFALTLPLIYFSRDTYTEPLSAVFFLSSLSLLILAIRARMSNFLWAIAGLVSGVGALVRIDSLLPIAGLFLFTGIYLALQKKNTRKVSLRRIGLLTASALLPIILGWFNFSLLTGRYFDKHLSPYLLQVYLIGVIIICIAAIITISWRTPFLSWLEKRSRTWRIPVSIGVMVAIVTFLASRPFWYTGYSAGVRSYAEYSLNWIVWYIGPVIAVLSFLGVCIALHRALRNNKQTYAYLALLSVILIPTFIYIVQPSIAPDHIWASRRLLPIIIPGCILFGTLALAWLYNRTGPRSIARIGIIVVAIVAFLSPLATSLPFLRLEPYAQINTINAVCNKLPTHATVVWVGTARTEAIQPTRLFCQLPTGGYGQPFKKEMPSRTDLAAIAKQAKNEHRLPIVALYATDQQILDKTATFTLLSTFETYNIRPTTTTPPHEISKSTQEFLFGIIQEDGSITPL